MSAGPLSVYTLDLQLRAAGMMPWTVKHRTGWLIHVEDTRAVVMCDDIAGVLDALRVYQPVHEGGRRVVVKLGQPARSPHRGRWESIPDSRRIGLASGPLAPSPDSMGARAAQTDD